MTSLADIFTMERALVKIIFGAQWYFACAREVIQNLNLEF